MIGHTHQTTDLTAIAHRGAARQASMRGNHAMRANLASVGNMHRIVQFGACPDHCVLCGAPVDAAIGPDIHIITNHHAPKLGKGFQPPWPRHIAKAGLPDARPRHHRHPRAQNRMGNGHLWANPRGIANLHMITNHRQGTNHRPSPKANAPADDRAMANVTPRANAGTWVNLGRGGKFSLWGRVWIKPQRQAGIGQLGLGHHHQNRAIPCAFLRQLGRNQHCPGLAMRQAAKALWVFNEGHIPRPGLINRRGSGDLALVCARGPHQRRHLRQTQGGSHRKQTRVGHHSPASPFSARRDTDNSLRLLSARMKSNICPTSGTSP